MASQLGLGRLFDVSTGFTPVNMATAANTGKRVSLKNADAVTVVVFKGAGASGEPPTVTLNQHTASSNGTSGTLAKITEVYTKVEATLDGDETWTKVTQDAAATYAMAAGDSEAIIAFTVSADSLSDGYGYISADIADVGSTAQIGGILYILHDLKVKRAPANLQAPLS